MFSFRFVSLIFFVLLYLQLVFCAFTLINIDKSICEPLDVGYWFRYLVNSDTSATDMPTLPPIIKSFENMPSENGYNYR